MNHAHYVEGQVLFREGDPADSVFRLLSGAVDISGTSMATLLFSARSVQGSS